VSDTHSRRRRHRSGTSRGRAIALLLILVAAGGGYALGLNIEHRDLAASKQLVQQLQNESQNLKKQISSQGVALTSLQAKFASMQSAMNEMKPEKDTYSIKPNESLIVADGRVTVGLIGSPANNSVDININGKRQSAAPGDVIKVAVDPTTTCQVTVQSFDPFKAVFTATCGAAKP